MKTLARFLSHLHHEKQFVKDLYDSFDDDQAELIVKNLKNPELKLDDDLYDEFWDWFVFYIDQVSQPILIIEYSSDNWGNGESGGVVYGLGYGIYSVHTGDYDEEDDWDLDKFDRTSFLPSTPKVIKAEVIRMRSTYFTEGEMIPFLERLIFFRKPYPNKVSINNRDYSIDFVNHKLLPA